MTTFSLETTIAASPARVYDLSRDIDAHEASMAASGETAVGGTTEGLLELGQTVTWRARHFGFTFHMTSQLTETIPPDRFIDEQLEGPFEFWWHLHVFEAIVDGTLMTDTIRYEPPFGWVGLALDRVFLRRYLIKLISQRNLYIKETAESIRG